MDEIAKKIAATDEEIAYYKNLNNREPSRTLGTLIKKLKVRKHTLEELL